MDLLPKDCDVVDPSRSLLCVSKARLSRRGLQMQHLFAVHGDWNPAIPKLEQAAGVPGAFVETRGAKSTTELIPRPEWR